MLIALLIVPKCMYIITKYLLSIYTAKVEKYKRYVIKRVISVPIGRRKYLRFKQMIDIC